MQGQRRNPYKALSSYDLLVNTKNRNKAFTLLTYNEYSIPSTVTHIANTTNYRKSSDWAKRRQQACKIEAPSTKRISYLINLL